ncbi:hypothetical protein ACET3Z_027304 [Daucus carota]
MVHSNKESLIFETSDGTQQFQQQNLSGQGGFGIGNVYKGDGRAKRYETIARLIESGDSEQIFQKAIQEQARGQGIGILLSGLFGTGNGSSVSIENADAVRVKGQNGSKFNTFQVYFGIIRGGSELFSLSAKLFTSGLCCLVTYME